MTFDLSSDQQQLQAQARTVALEQIAPAASAIDHHGAVAADLRAALERASLLPTAGSAGNAAVVIEEWARASGAVAAAGGLGSIDTLASVAWNHGPDTDSPGLRGLGAVDEALHALAPDALARARVVLSAVAVGIGHAALDEALTFMRAHGDRPGGNPDERPHWILADAAAELDAARLLTQKAAQAVDAGDGRADASLAKMFAAEVAQRAVDAALRILGAEGYRRGTVLERLTRDARAIALVGGSPESTRAFVADLTLPS